MGDHITHLVTKGLRAHDLDIRPGRLTLVTGQVGAGKSTSFDALSIGFLGNVPRIGKDPKAIGRIMRGRELSVRAHLSSGEAFERGYVRKGQKLEGQAEATWLPPKSGLTESCEAIRDLVGRDDREAAEAIDLRELLSASPNSRASRMEELLDASGIPAAELVRRGSALTALRLAGVDPKRHPENLDALEAAATGAAPLLETDVHRAVLVVVQKELGRAIRDKGLAHALAEAGETKKDAAQRVTRRVAARAEIEDRLRELNAPAEAVADAEARKVTLLEKKAAAERDLKAAREAAEIRGKYEPALPGLTKALEEAQARLAEASKALPEAEKARAEAEELYEPPPVDAPEYSKPDPEQMAKAAALEAEARAIPELESAGIPEEDAVRIEALRADATRQSREADEVEIPEPLSIAQAEVDRATADGDVRRAAGSPWREVEQVADALDEVEAEMPGIVPGRSKIGDCAATLRRLAAKNGGDLEKARVALDDAEAALAKAQARAQEREREIAAAKQRREDLRKAAAEARELATQVEAEAQAKASRATLAARAARKERVDALLEEARTIRSAEEALVEKANAELRELYEKAVGDREAEVVRVRARRTELLRRHQTALAAVNDAQAAVDKAQSDLREAQARLDGIASVTADAEVAGNERSAAVADLAELEETLQTLRGAESLRAEMESLAGQIDEATAERDAWTAAEWACQRLRELDMAARATGLADRMRRYLRAAGRTEEPYLRAGRGVTDFGWRRDGEEISVEALSGGEHVLFCTALAGAIVSLRAPKVRIVLVEANEIGVGPEWDQLCGLCGEMVGSGDLDQVLVATNLPVSAPEGWTVVYLGAPIEAVA